MFLHVWFVFCTSVAEIKVRKMKPFVCRVNEKSIHFSATVLQRPWTVVCPTELDELDWKIMS